MTAGTGPRGSCDVRASGARGDGVTLDTPAIQQAIDTCARQGGGEVAIGAGTFLTGTLHLRSHVHLRLAAGAVLRGSGNIADYQIDPEQTYAPGIIGPVLIFAQDCENVGICGEGMIDGSGGSFPKKMDTPRPVMARFRDCTRVKVRGVSFRDGASWTVHTIGCRDVWLGNLDIHSLLQPTNDGLDIDSCEGVCVRGCVIETSDDAIALKATLPGRPCRDVTISDCRLRSWCQAIRVGPESVADFEQITVTNCLIRDTGMGGICLQVAHGGRMRDVMFSHILMDRVSNPISIRLGGWCGGDENNRPWFIDDAHWQDGRLTDVSFHHIRARVPRRYLEGTPKESHTFKENEKTCITITGTPTTRPARILFDDVEVTFPGGGTAADAARIIPQGDRQYPTPYMFGVPPAYALFARHVDGLVLRDVRFRLASPDARPAVVCDDVIGYEGVVDADRSTAP